MSDNAEGTVANAGQTVQRGINQASDMQGQLAEIIRDKPIASALIAVGIGYLLGKII
jgi:hypothetical protein